MNQRFVLREGTFVPDTEEPESAGEAGPDRILLAESWRGPLSADGTPLITGLAGHMSRFEAGAHRAGIVPDALGLRSFTEAWVLVAWILGEEGRHRVGISTARVDPDLPGHAAPAPLFPRLSVHRRDAPPIPVPEPGPTPPRASTPSGIPRIVIPPHLVPEAPALELVLEIRPCPDLRAGTELSVASAPDPREQPRTKGPDLDLLSRFRAAEAAPGTHDVVLVDAAGSVREAANGALAIRDARGLLVPADTEHMLSSVTLVQLAALVGERGVPTRLGPVRLDDLGTAPLFYLNAVQGLSPVTGILVDGERIEPPRDPEAERWREAWESSFVPFVPDTVVHTYRGARPLPYPSW